MKSEPAAGARQFLTEFAYTAAGVEYDRAFRSVQQNADGVAARFLVLAAACRNGGPDSEEFCAPHVRAIVFPPRLIPGRPGRIVRRPPLSNGFRQSVAGGVDLAQDLLLYPGACAPLASRQWHSDRLRELRPPRERLSRHARAGTGHNEVIDQGSGDHSGSIFAARTISA